MKENVYSGEAALNASKVAAETSHTSSRPSLGFPIGTALLLLVVFFLSGLISCCYHWEKLRFFCGGRRSPPSDLEAPSPDDDDDDDQDGRRPSDGVPSPPIKSNRFHQDEKYYNGHSLPVIMPGNRAPTFIAWHCPHVPSLPPPLSSPPAPPLPSSVKLLVINVPDDDMSSPSREPSLPSDSPSREPSLPSESPSREPSVPSESPSREPSLPLDSPVPDSSHPPAQESV